MSTKFLLAAVTALQLLQVAVANAESDRIEPDAAYKDSSYCQFPRACDQSTPGTGHKFFTGNLTEDLITVERCYSFCFKNVRQYVCQVHVVHVIRYLEHFLLQFSSSNGSAAHFPDIFTGDPCSANNKDVSRHFTARWPAVSSSGRCMYLVYLCLQAFVCYAACLFSAKDALKRILPELSVPDDATCEHYCQLKVSKRSSLSTLI